MKKSISLLRTVLGAAVLLVPQVLFAQQPPDQEQPQTPEKPPTDEQDPQKQQPTQKEEPTQKEPTLTEGTSILSPIFEFDRIQIETGLMGNARAESSEVRKLSSKIVRDHLKLDDKIVSYSLEHQVELQPPSEQRQPMPDLGEAQGAEFDRQFVDQLLSMHNQQLEALTNQLEQVQDKKLRSLLNDTQKVLQEHVKQAERVKKEIGGMATG